MLLLICTISILTPYDPDKDTGENKASVDIWSPHLDIRFLDIFKDISDLLEPIKGGGKFTEENDAIAFLNLDKRFEKAPRLKALMIFLRDVVKNADSYFSGDTGEFIYEKLGVLIGAAFSEYYNEEKDFTDKNKYGKMANKVKQKETNDKNKAGYFYNIVRNIQNKLHTLDTNQIDKNADRKNFLERVKKGFPDIELTSKGDLCDLGMESDETINQAVLDVANEMVNMQAIIDSATQTLAESEKKVATNDVAGKYKDKKDSLDANTKSLTGSLSQFQIAYSDHVFDKNPILYLTLLTDIYRRNKTYIDNVSCFKFLLSKVFKNSVLEACTKLHDILDKSPTFQAQKATISSLDSIDQDALKNSGKGFFDVFKDWLNWGKKSDKENEDNQNKAKNLKLSRQLNRADMLKMGKELTAADEEYGDYKVVSRVEINDSTTFDVNEFHNRELIKKVVQYEKVLSSVSSQHNSSDYLKLVYDSLKDLKGLVTHNLFTEGKQYESIKNSEVKDVNVAEAIGLFYDACKLYISVHNDNSWYKNIYEMADDKEDKNLVETMQVWAEAEKRRMSTVRRVRSKDSNKDIGFDIDDRSLFSDRIKAVVTASRDTLKKYTGEQNSTKVQGVLDTLDSLSATANRNGATKEDVIKKALTVYRQAAIYIGTRGPLKGIRSAAKHREIEINNIYVILHDALGDIGELIGGETKEKIDTVLKAFDGSLGDAEEKFNQANKSKSKKSKTNKDVLDSLDEAKERENRAYSVNYDDIYGDIDTLDFKRLNIKDAREKSIKDAKGNSFDQKMRELDIKKAQAAKDRRHSYNPLTWIGKGSAQAAYFISEKGMSIFSTGNNSLSIAQIDNMRREESESAHKARVEMAFWRKHRDLQVVLNDMYPELAKATDNYQDTSEASPNILFTETVHKINEALKDTGDGCSRILGLFAELDSAMAKNDGAKETRIKDYIAEEYNQMRKSLLVAYNCCALLMDKNSGGLRKVDASISNIVYRIHKMLSKAKSYGENLNYENEFYSWF